MVCVPQFSGLIWIIKLKTRLYALSKDKTLQDVFFKAYYKDLQIIIPPTDVESIKLDMAIWSEFIG